MSNCDHCGKDLVNNRGQSFYTEITWCAECVMDEEALLTSIGLKDVPIFYPGRKTVYTWSRPDNVKIISTIPKKNFSMSGIIREYCKENCIPCKDIPMQRAERPCKGCGRMNDCGVKKCWNCEIISPC